MIPSKPVRFIDGDDLFPVLVTLYNYSRRDFLRLLDMQENEGTEMFDVRVILTDEPPLDAERAAEAGFVEVMNDLCNRGELKPGRYVMRMRT